MAYSAPQTMNANAVLDDPLLGKCIKVLDGVDTRRITFRPEGSEPSQSERLIPNKLRRQVRRAVGASRLPIRLYFSARTKRSGRPPMPWRDEAFTLINAGHRIEAVAAFYGAHRQTIQNWGARQPPADKTVSPPQDRFDDLVASAVGHLDDVYNCGDTAEDAIEALGLKNRAKARLLFARVGMVIEAIDEGVLG